MTTGAFRQHSSGTLPALGAILAPMCAGCASGPAPTSSSIWPAERRGVALRADSILAAGEAGASEFNADDGSGAQLRIECTREGSGRFHLRRERRTRGEESWRASVDQVLVRTPEGHVALAEEINHDERVELLYDPPLVLVPATLYPGGPPFEQATGMVVHPLGDRTRVRARGHARQTIEHEGGDAAVTSAGAASQRIRLAFEASLTPAEVTNLTLRWYDADGRLVAERHQERTRVLGVQTRRNRESWTIAQSPR